MAILKVLKSFLTEKGFIKNKGSQTYYKMFNNGFYAVAEVRRERNYVVYDEANRTYRQTEFNFYDMHIDITHEKIRERVSERDILTNFCAGNSLCRIAGRSERDWLKTSENAEQQIIDDIENSFDEFFYKPLFEDADTSVYDFLCELDIKRIGFVLYSADLFPVAAMAEKRYDDALYCVKCQMLDLLNRDEPCIDDSFDYDISILTDEKIAELRNEKTEKSKAVFRIYDEIINQ